MQESTTNKIVVYSTSWCGDCYRAKYFLDNYGIDYVDVNLEQNPEAVEVVKRYNQGYQSVPTLVFPDGSVLVEPSFRELADKTGVQL